MPDGGILNEDFPHIANTLAELIKAKKIPAAAETRYVNHPVDKKQRSLTGLIMIIIILVIVIFVIYGFSTGWIQQKLNLKI